MVTYTEDSNPEESPQPTFMSSNFASAPYWFEYVGLPANEWNASPYGQLNAKNDQLSLQLMTYNHEREAPLYRDQKWGWVIGNVQERLEDEAICHFEAWKMLPDGTFRMEPGAAFAVFVEGGEAGPPVSKGTMGIQWSIRGGNEFYVPYPKLMPTPETGGYRVQMADQFIPSELFQFGELKGQENVHTGLIIRFVLIPLPDDYPWGK